MKEKLVTWWGSKLTEWQKRALAAMRQIKTTSARSQLHTKNFQNIALLAMILLTLSGCSSPIQSEQPSITNEVLLSTGYPVGQTFVARYDGLSGIYFHLSPDSSGDGEIILHLHTDAQSGNELAKSYNSVRVDSITKDGIYGFFIPPQSSSQKYYYAFLEVSGNGSVKVGTAPGETYLNGALYKNHKPQESQTSFQLSYSRRAAILGVLEEILGWSKILLMSGFLFILPGWGLLCVLLPKWRKLTWTEKLGLSVGVSTAIYPLLLLWTNLLDLHLGTAYAWVPLIVGTYLLVWKNRDELDLKQSKISISRTKQAIHSFLDSTSLLRSALLLAALALIIITRFWSIRMLVAPMWGDSVHHTAITQLLVDHDGLFTSWEPYAPYHSLTTHYGFSALAALFVWLNKINAAQATLWMGQMLNVFAILSIYPLATRISRGNPWVGVGTLLVAGLASPIPAIYTNWGRYAQLAGQAILPVALWLLWEAIDYEENQRPWKPAIIAGITLAGMMLSYYRTPPYYASFVFLILLIWGLPKWHANVRQWGTAIATLAIIAIVAGIAFSPWIMRLTGSSLAASLEIGVSQATPIEWIVKDFRNWQTIFEHIPSSLFALGLISTIWAIIRRQWVVAIIPLWVGFLVLYRLGALIKIPGANMMDNFAIIILLYLPVGISVGWSFGEILHILEKKPKPAMLWVACTFIVLIAAKFAWQQRSLIAPNTYALFTYPDQRAMQWISDHTQAESTFLVQGYRIYDGYSAVGSDGGWWLPWFTQRKNTMPPQYALFNEAPTPPEYSQNVVSLVATLENELLDAPTSIEMLCAWGITHIYQGQRQGQAGFGATQLFSPDEMLAAPDKFELVYQQDRVSIFALIPQACHTIP